MKSKTTQALVSGTLFGKFFVDGQWKVIEFHKPNTVLTGLSG